MLNYCNAHFTTTSTISPTWLTSTAFDYTATNLDSSTIISDWEKDAYVYDNNPGQGISDCFMGNRYGPNGRAESATY
jgi:hypothetical protein